MTTWFALFIGLFCSFSFSQVKVTRNGNQIDYEFSIEKFQISDEYVDHKKFQKITLLGVEDYEGVYHSKGEPLLPVIRFYVYGAGYIKVTSNADRLDFSSTKIINILRALDPLPKMEGAKKVLSPELDSSLDFETTFNVEEVGLSQGVLKRLVTLYPVHWDATTGTVRKISQFKVTVPAPEAIESPEKSLMVFVVADKFIDSDSLQKLIQHKKTLGFNTKTISINTQQKAPDKIRQELRTIYLENSNTLKYVILIGSARLLPGFRSKRLNSGITDHYYRCLDTEDYESDIGTPDILLGRLSVKTEEELDTHVARIIDYQTKRFDTPEWLKKVAFIATNDKDMWETAEASNNYTINKYTSARGLLGNFPQTNNLGGDKLYAFTHKANGTDVIKAINEGRGLIQYSGHGVSAQWEYPRMTISDVENIAYSGAIPIVISNACSTAKITARDSFAESWMRSKNGAVFFWGAVHIAYWEEDVVLQKMLSDELFERNNLEIGSLTSNALLDVWRYWGGKGESKYYMELYLSLGDPSLTLQIK